MQWFLEVVSLKKKKKSQSALGGVAVLPSIWGPGRYGGWVVSSGGGAGWAVGCVGCMNEPQGSFFSPLFISGEFAMTLKKRMNK